MPARDSRGRFVAGSGAGSTASGSTAPGAGGPSAGGFSLRVKVLGTKEIARRLAGLDRKIARKIVRAAMRKGQKRVAEQARKEMPVDKGTARKSIQVRAGKARRGMIRLNVQLNTQKILEAAKNHFFYPAILEYGSDKLHRVAIRPMRIAYESAGDEAKSITEREILAGIEREA